MNLKIQNIGKVSNADIELNGITVIAGENDTGKSTVGKVLFSIFNSYFNIDNQIDNDRELRIKKLLELIYNDVPTRYYHPPFNMSEISQNLIKNSNKYINNPTMLRYDILYQISESDPNFEENLEKLDDERLDEIFDRVKNILTVSREQIFKDVLDKNLVAEFDIQISNIYSNSDSKIELTIKDEKVSISISDNKVVNIENEFSLTTEAVYIDDPFVLDETPRYVYFNDANYHRRHLISKLFFEKSKSSIFDEIITKDKLEKIFSKINSACPGDIIRNKGRFSYKNPDTNKSLPSKNISTGLKTFVILKTLLVNGFIEYNGTIILDEPEIHLHPQWQLIFAEIIVLLQKEFNMHILLNTHSPYFLEAIEVYSEKYGIADKCKYYLAENQNETSIISDVTGNTEKIYQKLAKPLQILENERYSDD